MQKKILMYVFEIIFVVVGFLEMQMAIYLELALLIMVIKVRHLEA